MVLVEQSDAFVCVSEQLLLNSMTSDIDIWLPDLSSHCLGHVRRSRSKVKVHGHRKKNIVKVVSETSTGSFLVVNVTLYLP